MALSEHGHGSIKLTSVYCQVMGHFNDPKTIIQKDRMNDDRSNNASSFVDQQYYADDSTVTVKIPANLPDPINNPITVTTKYGTATYGFKIMQPAPIITRFNPEAGAIFRK